MKDVLHIITFILKREATHEGQVSFLATALDHKIFANLFCQHE